MGKRGDRFASWCFALPKGRKFMLSAIMASTTILSPVLLMAPTVSWGSHPTEGRFEFLCEDNRNGDHQVSVELPSDPDQINEMNANPEQFVALFRSVCPSY